jgi:hypothetical protein
MSRRYGYRRTCSDRCEACEEIGDPADPSRFCYDVRHLMRFPLGMLYPAMVNEIGLILSRPSLHGSPTELVIDETGVGRAVGDIFNQAGLKPIKVTITAGNEEGQSGPARFTVPKQILVSNLDAMMHTGELRIAKDLRETPALGALAAPRASSGRPDCPSCGQRADYGDGQSRTGILGTTPKG